MNTASMAPGSSLPSSADHPHFYRVLTCFFRILRDVARYGSDSRGVDELEVGAVAHGCRRHDAYLSPELFMEC